MPAANGSFFFLFWKRSKREKIAKKRLWLIFEQLDSNTWIVLIYWINGWSDELWIVDCIINTFHNHTSQQLMCYVPMIAMIDFAWTLCTDHPQFCYTHKSLSIQRSGSIIIVHRLQVVFISLHFLWILSLQMQNDSFAFLSSFFSFLRLSVCAPFIIIALRYSLFAPHQICVRIQTIIFG